jgi:hypothetical protein
MTQPTDVQHLVQTALDDDQPDVAFELLCGHAAATVDVQLLNDMAVIAHAGGQTAKAVDLLRAATVIAPDRADLKENLGVLEDDAPSGPEFVATGGGVQPLVPHMTGDELGLLRAVGGHRRFVVEFGCGGSTAEWLRLGAERVVSVESDAAWVTELRDHPDLADAVACERLTLIHANVGPTGPWGAPQSKSHMDRWPRYWSGVWELPAVAEAELPVDLVFVDGRFRVACALNAALHVERGTPIVIHDFCKRPHYKAVLKHLAVVAEAESLVVLQHRPDFDPARVVDDLARHALDLR